MTELLSFDLYQKVLPLLSNLPKINPQICLVVSTDGFCPNCKYYVHKTDNCEIASNFQLTDIYYTIAYHNPELLV